MGNTRRQTSVRRRVMPATTPEELEDRMIMKAMRVAEEQMDSGTASSQVITHYLKLGSSRERLEQERLANENIVLKARAEQLESQRHVEELIGEALEAMRTYTGYIPVEEGGYED